MAEALRTIGPYRILRPLGQGGMGVVYLAERLGTQNRLALKTVRVPRADTLQSIRREIHALARIRHPGVVRIVEEGEEQGLPWYAMELLEGRPLSRWATEPGARGTTATLAKQPWWTSSLTELGDPSQDVSSPASEAAGAGRSGGLALADAMGLVRRLCAPLAFLHGEGIVHRDLKPDNVLVRNDGRPVLVDFGLAAMFATEQGRDALNLSTTPSGTLTYMAPEQISGELVDARADLYALGCIFYELLTGRPPFVGDSPAQLMRAHLEIAPTRPSDLVEGLSPELDALVLRLLAKRPRDRLGHAGDLAAALHELGAANGAAADEPAPRAYLYRPGLAGRQKFLDELDARLASLEDSGGGLVFLDGESGAGKTRLLLELARQARRRRISVLTGECLPRVAVSDQGRSQAGAPLHALRRVLQHVADRCRERPDQAERLVGPRGRVLAAYEPSLSGLAGQAEYPEPAELPASAAQLRLFLYLAETLEALCEKTSLLLILDDLQWSDEVTLGLLRFMLGSGRLERMGLLVVGAFRTEELGQDLRALIADPKVQRLTLGRLAEEAVGKMVGDMLALVAPPQLLTRTLSEQSEGNPFFVAEYLRTAVGMGVLFRDRQGRWQAAQDSKAEALDGTLRSLPLPGSLRELVGRRLELLSPQAMRLARMASVLGRQVHPALLADAAAIGAAEGMDAIGDLLARQVFEEAEAGQLRFVHDKIRELVYERLSDEERRELHRSAAVAMERRPGADRQEHLTSIGYHWEQAAEARLARQAYLTAGRLAVSRDAILEAERLYRQCLRLSDPAEPETVQVRIEMVLKVLTNRGAVAESREQIESLLDQARSIDRLALDTPREGRVVSLEAMALTALAMNRNSEGKLVEALALWEQVLGLEREWGNRGAEGEVLFRIATIRQGLGHVGQVPGLLTEAIEILREAGSTKYEAAAVSSFAQFHAEAGRFAEALSYCDLALQMHRAQGHRYAEADALRDQAAICHELGRFEEARTLYETALRFYREAGDPRSVIVMLCNLGQLQAEHGPPEEAARHFQEALGLQRELGLRKFSGITLTYAAALERRSGALDEAHHLLEQARPAFLESGAQREIALYLCERAHLALANADVLAAVRWQNEALATAEPLQAGPESELGRSLNRLARAVTAFEAGHALFRGECLDDVSVRCQS